MEYTFLLRYVFGFFIIKEFLIAFLIKNKTNKDLHQIRV